MDKAKLKKIIGGLRNSPLLAVFKRADCKKPTEVVIGKSAGMSGDYDIKLISEGKEVIVSGWMISRIVVLTPEATEMMLLDLLDRLRKVEDAAQRNTHDISMLGAKDGNGPGRGIFDWD